MNWAITLVSRDPAAPRRAGLYRWALILCVCAAVTIAEIDTIPGVWGDWAGRVQTALFGLSAVPAADWLLRLYAAWTESGSAEIFVYGLSLYGLIDLAAALPFLALTVAGLPPEIQTIAGVVMFLKLARYSPALETLGAVLRTELRPLASAMFIMVLLVLFSSVVLYFVERGINPGLSSVPHAMWWSVVTLATLGYGDVVPMTVLGKILGGMVGILGLGMFALPASILASGFTEEMRRRNFVDTWHLVAKVPFFSRFQAADIAAVTALLKVYGAMRGEVLMRRGDQGDGMYFIVSGQVEVQSESGLFTLKAGDFFGEIALLERRPRMATVRALTRCNLLVLSAGDFQKFVQSSPDLIEAVREVAKSRLAESKKGEGG